MAHNLILVFAFSGITIISVSYGAAHGYQTGSNNMFPHINKLDEKLSTNQQVVSLIA